MVSLSKKIQNEFISQLEISVPAFLFAMGNSLPWFISIAFVGRIGGADQLAAAALASSLCNVTGISLSTGLSSAVVTLTGQCKGDVMERRRRRRRQQQVDNQSMIKQSGSMPYPMTPQTYLYRGIFIQLMFVLPVGLIWIYGIKDTLISLGQNDVIAEMADEYLRWLTPGLWAYGINHTLSAWLQAIGMADVPIYGVLTGLVFHVPMNYFFIYTLDFGFQGASMATSFFRILQTMVTLFYLRMTPNGKNRVSYNTTGATNDYDDGDGNGDDTMTPPLSFEIHRAICSLKGICQYLGLALPGIVLISEWWASEICIFFSGLLPSPGIALAGITIVQSLIIFCFKLPAGISVACSTRVSNLLGGQDGKGARLAAIVSSVYALSACLTMAIILYVTPHDVFPSIFTPDPSVILEVAKIMPLVSFYVIVDGLQYAMEGIIKGCGRQCSVMPIPIFAYWIVGVPLAYYMAFGNNTSNDNDNDNAEHKEKVLYGLFQGIGGIVFGMAVGSSIHAFLVFLVVGFGTDWDIEVQKVQERLKLEQDTKTTKTDYNDSHDIENSEKTKLLKSSDKA